MDKQTATTLFTQEPRKIIVSYSGPPIIHKLNDKLEDPTIWVYLIGDEKGYGNMQVIVYSNTPFNYSKRKKAKLVGKNPVVYQASNIKNNTGEIVEDCWTLIDRLAAVNDGEVDWSGIVLYHFRKQSLEERAKAA